MFIVLHTYYTMYYSDDVFIDDNDIHDSNENDNNYDDDMDVNDKNDKDITSDNDNDDNDNNDDNNNLKVERYLHFSGSSVCQFK